MDDSRTVTRLILCLTFLGLFALITSNLSLPSLVASDLHDYSGFLAVQPRCSFEDYNNGPNIPGSACYRQLNEYLSRTYIQWAQSNIADRKILADLKSRHKSTYGTQYNTIPPPIAFATPRHTNDVVECDEVQERLVAMTELVDVLLDEMEVLQAEFAQMAGELLEISREAFSTIEQHTSMETDADSMSSTSTQRNSKGWASPVAQQDREQILAQIQEWSHEEVDRNVDSKLKRIASTDAQASAKVEPGEPFPLHEDAGRLIRQEIERLGRDSLERPHTLGNEGTEARSLPGVAKSPASQQLEHSLAECQRPSKRYDIDIDPLNFVHCQVLLYIGYSYCSSPLDRLQLACKALASTGKDKHLGPTTSFGEIDIWAEQLSEAKERLDFLDGQARGLR